MARTLALPKSVFIATPFAAVAALEHVDEKARSFFAPLKGKSTTFIVSDRVSGLAFAKSIAALISASGQTCSILDLDAFYASNADVIFAPRSPDPGKVAIKILGPTTRFEDEFPRIFSAAPAITIIDTLNTLYHLMSSDEGAYRSRKFSLAVASLSFLARESGGVVMLTMYRREPLGRRGQGKTMAGYSDLAVAVQATASEITLLAERGSAWPDGSLSIRIP